MYSKFRIKKSCFDNITFSFNDKIKGKQIAKKFKIDVKERLDVKFKDGKIIDGTATQEEWFPQISCDIFLSHSHRDIDKAYELSGWLKTNFNLDVFIDSNIWGNINDLLKKIDNEYCYNKKSKTYSYEKRNITTSHVHMMLINALVEMIDNSECLMFFETPNSIRLKKMLHEVETASPWIYSELVLSKIVRSKKNERHKNVKRSEKRYFALKENKINVSYKIDTSHLVELSNKDFIDWKRASSLIIYQDTHPLDLLYEIKLNSNE